MTVRHRGGGHKRQYRIIDFKRTKDDVPAKVVAIEYDPNRTANIALLQYTDGTKAYILAPKGLEVGMTVQSGEDADIKLGNSLPLSKIPDGTQIHNIELKPGHGGQLVRSAGASAQVLGKEGKYVLVRLQSGEVRMILAVNRATVGVVGNEQHSSISWGGWSPSLKGQRPHVRGSVMNPNDHPHGVVKERHLLECHHHCHHGVRRQLVRRHVTKRHVHQSLSFVAVRTSKNRFQLL